MLPVIFGISGLVLTDEERDFFRAFPPFGFILFKRNIDTPEQVKALNASLRNLTGRADTPILVDQEGGRVQRLRPPHWIDLPSMRQIGDLFVKNSLLGMQASKLHAEIIAGQLTEIGFDVVCAPVLDVPTPGAHDVIGHRAFSEDVDVVIPLGANISKEFLANGVMPVIKHVPGHGRADADSHYDCPVVKTDKPTLEQTDFKAFRGVTEHIGGEKLWAMTAHVVFTALDEQPVSVSKAAIMALRNDMGVTGPIIPDAIEMEALGGTLPERALATLNAGCDAVLHCSGKLDDMKEIAQVLPKISDESLQRFAIAAQARKEAAAMDWRTKYAELAKMLNIETADGYTPHEALTIA
jgi:beta-N-acetylhexosaminidase